MAKETDRLRCIYIFQFDEVRYDHLSVYGYHRRQKNIDAIAKEGVAFKQAISGSSFTPVATSVLWTGMIAAHAGVRRPGDMLQAASLQEYIKMLGWTTMGCVSQHIVGSSLGMNFGFDRLVEPTDVNAQDAWGNAFEHGKHLGIRAAPRDALRAVPVGKYYVNENIDFIRTNKKGNFYLYNQYYETHTCSENYLLRSGRLKEHIEQ